MSKFYVTEADLDSTSAKHSDGNTDDSGGSPLTQEPDSSSERSMTWTPPLLSTSTKTSHPVSTTEVSDTTKMMIQKEESRQVQDAENAPGSLKSAFKELKRPLDELKQEWGQVKNVFDHLVKNSQNKRMKDMVTTFEKKHDGCAFCPECNEFMGWETNRQVCGKYICNNPLQWHVYCPARPGTNDEAFFNNTIHDEKTQIFFAGEPLQLDEWQEPLLNKIFRKIETDSKEEWVPQWERPIQY